MLRKRVSSGHAAPAGRARESLSSLHPAVCQRLSARPARPALLPSTWQPSTQGPAPHRWRTQRAGTASVVSVAAAAASDGPKGAAGGSLPPREIKLTMRVGGMMCDGCTSRVHEVLAQASGVSRAEVSLDGGGSASVWVACEPSVTQDKAEAQLLPPLLELVRGTGFEAEPQGS